MDTVFHIHDNAIEEGFNFAFGSALLDKTSFKKHSHDYSELIIMLRGEGVHETETGAYPVRAGDVYIIHPSESHGFRNCRNLEMVNIGFPDDVLKQKDLLPLPGFQALFILEPLYRGHHPVLSRLHLSPPELEKVRGFLDLLDQEVQRKRAGYQVVFLAVFRVLVVQLCRYCERGKPEERGSLIKIGRSLAELEGHYRESISIKDLARQSGYSVNHFSRLSERIYGVSPLQYIIQLRLSLAVDLLENSDLPVGEIAGRCGYDDPNYFCRLFKKRLGSSPGQFRRVRRGAKREKTEKNHK